MLVAQLFSRCTRASLHIDSDHAQQASGAWVAHSERLISSLSTHVLNLEHALGVLLDKVHLVSESAVDLLHARAHVIALRVVVLMVRHARRIAGWLSVRIRREDLCERVAHLQLPVECPIKVRLIRVETAVLTGPFGGRRPVVVFVLIERAQLEVASVFCIGRQVTLVMLVFLNQHRNLAHRAVVLLETLGLSAAADSPGRSGARGANAAVRLGLDLRIFLASWLLLFVK